MEHRLQPVSFFVSKSYRLKPVLHLRYRLKLVLHLACWLALFALSCSPHTDRAQWLKMSRDEKTLYVRSLLGHEKVKERKGGNDRIFTRAPEEYVARIDAAYARDDRRDPEAIFADLGEARR